MGFKTFIEEVRAEVQNKCLDKKVVIHDILKNNDVKLTGITIVEEGKAVSPNIYLERYYDEYCSGVQLEIIADSIINEWSRHCEDVDYSIIESLRDYEKIKDRIVLKLINRKSNIKRLKGIAYEEYLEDFALICYISIDLNSNIEEGSGSVNVTNGMLEQWNISKEEMFKQAYDNTMRLNKHLVKRLDDVILDIMKSKNNDMSEIEDMIHSIVDNDIKMLVLTTVNNINGAVVVIYDEVLDELAHIIGKSFYLIPSSIHEWIIVNEDISEENTRNITNMLIEVNASELDEQEKLSDNLYMYDFNEKKIKIAK